MGSLVLPPAIEIRAGTTDRLVIQLLADNDPIDLTGIDHIEIELRDARRNTYKYSSDDVSPIVGVYDTTQGKVYLDPTTTLFKAICSPYLFYVWIVDSELKRYSVPEEVEGLIKVRKNY